MRLRAHVSHILRSMGRSLLAAEAANQESNEEFKVKLDTMEHDRAIELARMLDSMNTTLAANFHRLF